MFCVFCNVFAIVLFLIASLYVLHSASFANPSDLWNVFPFLGPSLEF